MEPMTLEQIDALVQQGNFADALNALMRVNDHAAPDPGQLLQQFNLEVRVQRFSEAAATMERLLVLAPQAAPAMNALARNARAEAFATARLSDRDRATSRAGIGAPPPHAVAYVQALVLHAEERYDEAAEVLTNIKAAAPPSPGTLTWRNGQTARFSHVTDTDDLTGPIMPLYHGEDVLDIAFSQIRSITMIEARSSFDSMWMPVELTLTDGQTFKARYPALYPGSAVAPDPMARTAQTTMWNNSLGYARALGQRDLAFTTDEGGSMLVGVLQIARLDFDPPSRRS